MGGVKLIGQKVLCSIMQTHVCMCTFQVGRIGKTSILEIKHC